MKQLDLHIDTGTKFGESHQTEVVLSADVVVPENISLKEQQAGQRDLARLFGNALKNAVSPTFAPTTQPAETSTPTGSRKARSVARRTLSSATNWWLALIAFFLFLNLCFKD